MYLHSKTMGTPNPRYNNNDKEKEKKNEPTIEHFQLMYGSSESVDSAARYVCKVLSRTDFYCSFSEFR